MLTERRGSAGLLNVILCTKNRGSRSVNSALRNPSMFVNEDGMREKTFWEMLTVEQENFQTHLLRMQTAEQKAAQESSQVDESPKRARASAPYETPKSL